MIEIKFKECCNECENRNTYIEEDVISLYSGGGLASILKNQTTIGCKHEKVCQKYIETKVE